MKIINQYKIINNNEGYIESFYSTKDSDFDFEGQMADYPDVLEGWSKLENGQIVEDEEKKAEIIREREKESTEIEKIEAQLLYTAMMTDTLLEEV